MISGHIYVIEFSNGVIKVGRTANAKSRLSNHRLTARRFGVHVANSWVSLPHEDWVENEAELKKIASRLGGKADGQEYFTGLTFDALVREASALSFAPLSAEIVWERNKRRIIEALFPELSTRVPAPDIPVLVESMTGPDLDLARAALRERTAREGAEWAAFAGFYDRIRPQLKGDLTVLQACEQTLALYGIRKARTTRKAA